MGHDELCITINGEPILEQGVVALIYPGRQNTLGVTWRPRAGHSEILTTVKIICPDGRVGEETQRCGAGETVEHCLGPFAAPATYHFEDGVVYRQGYRVLLTVTGLEKGIPLARFGWYQGLTHDRDAETLFPGDSERVIYNDGYIPAHDGTGQRDAIAGGETHRQARKWYPFGHSGGPMDPPLEVSLSPAVLCNQDNVILQYRTRDQDKIRARLVVRNQHGQEMQPTVNLVVELERQETPIVVAGWPVGDYALEIRPILADTEYEGPVLVYRRREHLAEYVQISPLTPFRLQRDVSRDPFILDRWQEWQRSGWEAQETEDGEVLVETGAIDAEAIPLKLPLSGSYAIFGLAEGYCYLQNETDGLVRPVSPYLQADLGPTFIMTADMSTDSIRVLPNGEAGTGLRSLHFLPVTTASVVALTDLVQNPTIELRGVADWTCATHLTNQAWLRATGMGFRAEAGATNPHPEVDYVQGVLGTLDELGFGSVDWAIGRSWVEYPSQLPDAHLWPCAELTPDLLAQYPHFEAWRRLIQNIDSLQQALDTRHEHGLRVYPWLGMNRHYGPDIYGGIFHSSWIHNHPEFSQVSKDGKRDSSRVEYYFPEVRQERLNILAEVVERYSPDGLVLGFCRQPPMASYNPQMVDAYVAETGRDPRMMDIHDGGEFTAWLRWRAQFLTQFLRELRDELRAIETRLDQRLPVVARVPSGGLFWLLANGMDLETWMQEGLIDEVQIAPLEDHGSQAVPQIGPYMALGRKWGIPVLGGINLTGANGYNSQFNPVVGIRRALGLHAAGVDGIEIYEAEVFYHATPCRWLPALWAQPDLARQFLAESNLDAVYPVTATNAMLGHDNHWFYQPSLVGVPGEPLPRGATSWL